MKSTLNLDTFIKLKAAKDKAEKEPIVYKLESGEEIAINKLSEKQVTDIVETVDKDAPAAELWDSLIYAAIPELGKPEVLAEFECEDNPKAVVGKIFTMGERIELGKDLREAVEHVSFERIKN